MRTPSSPRLKIRPNRCSGIRRMNFFHLSVRKWSSRFTPSVMSDSGTVSPVGSFTWIPDSRTGSRTQVVSHPKTLGPLTRTGLLNSVRFIGFLRVLGIGKLLSSRQLGRHVTPQRSSPALDSPTHRRPDGRLLNNSNEVQEARVASLSPDPEFGVARTLVDRSGQTHRLGCAHPRDRPLVEPEAFL